MKILKTLKIILLSVCIVSSQISFADQKPIPPTVPVPPSEIPAAITVNPTTLRQQLLETNLSLVQTFNSVRDAKLTVDKVRTQLLPSLNLGAMLTGGFASAISFLIPFLAPSNWFNLKAQKNSFEAEKLAYLIMELNVYSSALSLYLTVYNDVETQKTYEDEAADLQKFASIYGEAVKIGAMSAADLLPLQGQADLASGAASQLAQLVDGEMATLRQLLGLPYATKITLEAADMAASPWEDKNIQDVINQANAVAPEHQQVEFLVKQAKAGKWSTVFGFINSSTYSNSTSSSALNLGASLNLNFGIFPSIKLASQNIKEVELLDTNVVQNNTSIVETAMTSLPEAKKQYDFFSQAETQYKTVYTNDIIEYQIGAVTLAQVIYDRAQIATATVSRLKAELNLNMQRVVMDRTLLLDQFSQIKGCSAANVPKGKSKNLDQLCHQTP